MSERTITKLILIAATFLFACTGLSSASTGEPTSQPVMPAPVSAVSVPALVPLVSLTKEQSSRFQGALTNLAAQAHVAIVAEGVPLHSQLVGRSVPNLTVPIPLSQALTALGAAYDYDVQREEGGVFVLTKRYSDPRDLPCVTLDECQASLKDVLRILDTFNPHFQESIYAAGPNTQRDTVISFFNSLSPAQLTAAQSKTLCYGNLLPDQKTLISNFILYQFVQMPLDKTQAQINLLSDAPHSILTGRNEYKQAGAYIEVPDLAGKHLASVTGELTAVRVGADRKPIAEATPDWLALPPVSLPETVKPLTLAQAVAALKPIHGQQPVVDKPIRAKPVTVAGLANADPMKLLEALEKLYGLRIGASDKSAPMLTRQAPQIPDKLNEIAADVWQALPLSYTRALDADAHQRTPQEKADASWMPANDYSTYSQEQGHVREASEQMQQEAVRRLRTAMQPYLRQHGLDARIPVSSLAEDDRSVLAIVLMSRIVPDLRDTFSGVPAKKAFDCLDNIDNMIVYTVPGETAHQNSVDIPSLYLQGSPVGSTEKVGMGGIRYFSFSQ